MEKAASIQVLDRAFSIVDVLSNCSESVSLAEISALTGISKSTAFRILKSLRENGYVAQNAYGQYYMTLKICTLSRRVLEKTSIISLAQPHMKRLCAITHQTIHLVVREGTETVYVNRQEDDAAPFHMTSVIGRRRSLHTSAVGKSILAALSNDEILNYWRAVDKIQITPYTIVNLDELFQEIEKIRVNGYAIDNQENTLGVRCIAAAIHDYIGTPSYAISISGPSEIMTDEKLESFAPFLLTTKASISVALGSE